MNGRPPTLLRVPRTGARLEEGDGDLLSARLDLPDLATIGPSDAIEALDSALLVAGSYLLFATADVSDDVEGERQAKPRPHFLWEDESERMVSSGLSTITQAIALSPNAIVV